MSPFGINITICNKQQIVLFLRDRLYQVARQNAPYPIPYHLIVTRKHLIHVMTIPVLQRMIVGEQVDVIFMPDMYVN